MIRYSLQCDKKHAFEGWFSNSAAFDKQKKRGLVSCPKCGSVAVQKALMAPNVVTSEKSSRKSRRPSAEGVAAPVAPPPVPAQQLAFSPEQREVLSRLRKLRAEVLAKSDYVGPRFAEEARRIDSGESPTRGIHGEASLDDVKSLAEDGIDVYPVPVLPDDQN
jgi:hypothetical protein